MANVIILAGPPGSGKTHYRKNVLPQNMPGVDIADVYAEHNERWPDIPIDWHMAHGQLLKEVRDLLEEHDEIWVEAMYAPGSPSLAMLLQYLKVAGVAWEIMRMDTDLQTCFARVAMQHHRGEVSAAKTKERNRILHSLMAKRQTDNVN